MELVLNLFSGYYRPNNRLPYFPSFTCPTVLSHLLTSSSIMNTSLDACQTVSTDSSPMSCEEIANLISSVFAFAPGSSRGRKELGRDYLRNFPLSNQLKEVPDIPGFVKELLSLENQLYLWSNVSKLPNNLSVPEDISIHILTTNIVEALRFEDIYGLVIHRSPQSYELSPASMDSLLSIQEDMRHLKVLVFLNVVLEDYWLTQPMRSRHLDLLCLENCLFADKDFLKSFLPVNKLYLVPNKHGHGKITLPESLMHLKIFCPKSEAMSPILSFFVSAQSCQKLETM